MISQYRISYLVSKLLLRFCVIRRSLPRGGNLAHLAIAGECLPSIGATCPLPACPLCLNSAHLAIAGERLTSIGATWRHLHPRCPSLLPHHRPRPARHAANTRFPAILNSCTIFSCGGAGPVHLHHVAAFPPAAPVTTTCSSSTQDPLATWHLPAFPHSLTSGQVNIAGVPPS